MLCLSWLEHSTLDLNQDSDKCHYEQDHSWHINEEGEWQTGQISLQTYSRG